MIRGIARPSIPPLNPPPCALIMIAGGTGEAAKHFVSNLACCVTCCVQVSHPCWRTLETAGAHSRPAARKLQPAASYCFAAVSHSTALPLYLTLVLRGCFFGGVLLWCVVVFLDVLRLDVVVAAVVVAFECGRQRIHLQ